MDGLNYVLDVIAIIIFLYAIYYTLLLDTHAMFVYIIQFDVLIENKCIFGSK